MNVVVPSFPLPGLPENAIIRVIHNMEFIHQLGFSLISETTKNLVKASKLKLEEIAMMFDGVFQLSVYADANTRVRLFFCSDTEIYKDWSENDPLMKLSVDFIQASNSAGGNDDTVFEWRKPQFGVRDWINHFMEVVNCTKIDSTIFMYDNFDIESIKEHINGLELKTLHIYEDMIIKDVYVRQILNSIQPVHTLDWTRESSQAHSIVDTSKILIQNFDSLNLFDFSQLTLNDLLLINSFDITIYFPKLNGKDLNQFIKHWINGSNPRLRKMRIMFRKEDTSLISDVLLRNILYLTTANDTFDVQRKDGTEATIEVVSDKIWLWFTMTVMN